MTTPRGGRERLLKAMEETTLVAAKAHYSSPEVFWDAARRYKLAADIKAQYAEEMRRNRSEQRKLANQDPAIIARNEARKANLIEDALFMAIHGETTEGAARRLGFKSWNSLYKRLTTDYDRPDITDRLTRNTERDGHLRQGTIEHRNGGRLP